MRDIIHEDILTLDIDRINFDDRVELKDIIIKLFSTIECLAQANRELREENQLWNKERTLKNIMGIICHQKWILAEKLKLVSSSTFKIYSQIIILCQDCLVLSRRLDDKQYIEHVLDYQRIVAGNEIRLSRVY